MDTIYKSKTKHLKYRLMSVMIMLSCVLHTMHTRAQAIISYPVSAQSLTRSLDTSLLTVKVDFASACTGITAEIRLPSGVAYVPGSVTATASSGGLTITDLGGTTSKPTFTISNAAVSNNIIFTIKRIANCGSATSGKDSVYITGSCGSTSETVGTINNYNIFSPSLSLTAPAAITGANLGSSYSRSFTVTNGGNGCLDTLRLCIVRPSGSVSVATIKIGAVTIVPYTTSGDTSFYKISGANLPGGTVAGKMCNGETVTFTENFTLANCAGLTTTYISSWGRDHFNPCQSVSGSALINMNTGVPNLTITCSAPALTSCRTTPRTMTLTITNTGSAPASNLDIAFGNTYNGALNPYFSSIYDTASIVVTPPTGPTFHPTTYNAVNLNVAGNANPLCTIGKIGSVDFNMPSGFVLGAGQSITITFNTQECTAGNCADYGHQGAYFSAGVNYKDQCAATSYSYPIGSLYVPNGATGYFYFTSVVPQLPAQVIVGRCFDYKIDMGLGTDAIYPTSYIDYTITLPTGISFDSASLSSGTTTISVAPRVSGSVYTFRVPMTAAQTMKINLCTSPASCGANTIAAVVSANLDSTCSSPEIFKSCLNSSMETVCGTPCPSGGVVPFDWDFHRITYGQPDNNNDGLPDGSGSVDTTLIDRDRYRPGDVLHSSYSSAIYANTIVPYSSWPYVFAEWNFAMGTWAPSGTATVVIKRASTSTTYTITGITISTLTAGTTFKADWHSSAVLPSGFTYLPGDSLYVYADFTLVSSIHQQFSGAYVLGYNIDDGVYSYDSPGIGLLSETVYASPVVSPPAGGLTGPDRFTCFVPKYNTNLIGLYHFVLYDGINSLGASGCSDYAISLGSYNRKLGTYQGGRYFNYEYRPETIPDTLVINLPNGWDFISQNGLDLYYTITSLYSGYSNIPMTPVVTTSASGTKLLYDFKSAFASAAIPRWSTDGMEYRITTTLRPNCATPATSTISLTEYAHWMDYPSAATPLHFVDSTYNSITYNAGSKPSITIQDNTGVVQGVQLQQYWDVQINNSSLVTAPYIWMALEKPATSGISIDSVVLKPSNVVLTPFSYGSGNKWYQVSTVGLASGVSQQARIYFKYSSCTLDSIQMKAGWNCSNYPSPDPSAYSCFVTSQYLKVSPQPSQIQLSISKQPTSPSIALCTQDSVTFIVNSAQAANLINSKLTIAPPAGLNVDLPIQIEYPLGSGIWQNATAVLSAGNYIVNLSDHTGIGANGIPGTVVNPGSTNRQAKVRVAYTSSCSFVSGSLISAMGNANNTCGGSAIGDGNSISSNAVNITGASTAGAVGISFSLPSSSVSCGNNMILALTVTPVITATQTGDTVIYTLPSNLSYTGGFVGGTNCASCSATATAGALGTTLVKVKLQTAVAAGSPLNFNFNVAPKGAGCNSVTIAAAAKRDIPALTCGVTPCSSSSVIIGSGTSGPITLNKPSLILTSLTTDSTHWVAGQYQKAYIKYNNNNGAQAYTGNTDSVEFFCGSSTTPFSVQPLTKNLAIGANDSDAYFIYIPKTGCTIGDLVTAKIQTTTAAGTAQCLCSPSSLQLAGVPLPLNFVSTAIHVNNCAVSIDWQYNHASGQLRAYVVERSNNGSIYTPIVTLSAQATSYIDVAPESGSWFYRIKAVGIDGNVTYSSILTAQTSQCVGNMVSVYPNPAQDQLQIILQGASSNNHYELIDALGRVVQQGDLQPNTNNKVEVNKISQGLYLLRVVMDESVTTQQIQIRR